MLNTLLVNQYSTNPAGVFRKKNRYINGMNAIDRIIACCCGSSLGMVVMRWLRYDVIVITISSRPGIANGNPGMWKTSGWPRLGSHKNGLLNAMSSIGGVSTLVTCISAGSYVTTA